jgi:hypothetical protein
MKKGKKRKERGWCGVKNKVPFIADQSRPVSRLAAPFVQHQRVSQRFDPFRPDSKATTVTGTAGRNPQVSIPMFLNIVQAFR